MRCTAGCTLRSSARSAVITFGLIESYIYVTLYVPDEGSDYVLFRFTVPILLHVTGSTMVGYGLTRTVIDWAHGAPPSRS